VTDKAVQNEVAVIKVREPLYAKNVLGTGRYGDIPMANVSAVQDYLVATGQLEKKLEPSEYYDNSLIDRINDFDADAIIARAKTFKLD
jgi:hypothetical protein